MKIDKSLQEVWEWKDKCYEDYKDKTWDERVELMNKNTEELKKNYNLKLRIIGSADIIRLDKVS